MPANSKFGWEKTFFHWITVRAFRSLGGKRDWTQRARGEHRAAPTFRIRIVIAAGRARIPEADRRFSDLWFTRALGRHGEMLVESGLHTPASGSWWNKVKEVDGRHAMEPTTTRLSIVRDGIRYGVWR